MWRQMWRMCKLVLLGVGLAGWLMVNGCSAPEQPAKAKKEEKAEPPLSPQAMEHFRQGHKFLAEQKLDEAFKEFQETVRLDPLKPLGYFWLGQVHVFRREKEQAEKAFQKVLELNPENYHAMAMLGKILSFERDRIDQAEEMLKKALKISPDLLEAHFDLGRVYALKGDRDRALGEFRYLMDKERDFFLYHFEMGRIYEAWGDKGQALSHYKRAQLLNPRFELAGQAIQRLEKDKKTGSTEGSSSGGAPLRTPPPTKQRGR